MIGLIAVFVGSSLFAKSDVRLNPAYKALFEQWLGGVTLPETPTVKKVLKTTNFPAHLDWRDMDGNNYLTAIKDQGYCATCAAFGFSSTFEASIKVGLKNPFIEPDVSEQFLFSCSGGNCFSGRVALEMLYLMQDTGIPDESCLNYHPVYAGCGQACDDVENRVMRPSSIEPIWNANPETIMAYLQDSPIAAPMFWYYEHYDYEGGIYHCPTGKPDSLHTVTLIGYDRDEKYWITKDQWGENWGENGYMRVAWGECAIGTIMIKFPVDPENFCRKNTTPVIFRPALAIQNIQAGKQLTIMFDFEDREANLSGGELWYRFDNGPAKRFHSPITNLKGTSSADSPDTKFNISSPLKPGIHRVFISVKDLCGAKSNEISVLFQIHK